MKKTSTLAIHGGPKSITSDPGDLFKWPIVTKEAEDAVLQVLRSGTMSGTDITKQFEKEFADWMGVEYALAYPNGTESLRGAMWACGLGAGDELICPSLTYWASCASALSLGATVNFADIDPDTLCIDPNDIEHRIGPNTRAIMVVHYAAYPCDMDSIMKIAKAHDIKVIEDTSHAVGSRYKGQLCGTIGDVSGISMMSGKSLPVGEAGMLVTNNRDIYEHAIAYGHYERTGMPSNYNPVDSQITIKELKPYAGLPLGGFKHRINQTCSAMGRVQLKDHNSRMDEIDKAMNRFWDLLEDVPGLNSHRPDSKSGSSKGGWYFPRGLYKSEELDGLSCETFCSAVRAEGVDVCVPGANWPLHTHPLFHTADLFHQGRPTAISFGQRDVRQGEGTLPVTENIKNFVYGVPWFKHDRPDEIEQYAAAYRKVSEHHAELL